MRGKEVWRLVYEIKIGIRVRRDIDIIRLEILILIEVGKVNKVENCKKLSGM